MRYPLKSKSPWLIAAVCLFTYLPALQSGFIGQDDAMLVTENPLVSDASLISWLLPFLTYDPELYVPLTILIYKFEYLFFGLSPVGYHLVNILLHTATALVAWQLCRTVFKQTFPALFTTLLFALHPLHAETVSWIAGRKDLLAGFFFMLALLSFSVQRYHWKTLGYLCLSLLSKGSGIIFPALLLIYESVQPSPRYRKTLPYFAVSGLFALIGYLGKANRVSEVSMLEIPSLAVQGIWLQLQHFILPIHLAPHYTVGTWPIVGSLVIIGLFAAAWWWRRRVPAFWYGLVFFLVVLSPSWLITSRRYLLSLTSDRYAYVAITGLCVAVSSVIYALYQCSDALQRKLITISCSLIIIVCVIANHQQLKLWRSTETLLDYTLTKNPTEGIFYYHKGQQFLERGNEVGAREWFEQGLKMNESPYAEQVLQRSLKLLDS